MDRIAREGVQFTRFYAAPVCAPTRAGVMTGRYYLRTGLYNTRFGGDTLGKNEITVAQLLKREQFTSKSERPISEIPLKIYVVEEFMPILEEVKTRENIILAPLIKGANPNC